MEEVCEGLSPLKANQQAELLERALVTLQDGIYVITRRATLVYINTSGQQLFEKLSGTHPVPGDHIIHSMRVELRTKARAAFRVALKNQTLVYREQVELEGKEAWFEFGYHPMTNEKGQVTHICAKTKDITAEVVLERKLGQERQVRKDQIIQAALAAQQKERAHIGRELHDNVNQVLTTVKLYTELCAESEAPDRNILRQSVKHLEYCINEIRKLSHQLEPAQEEAELEEPLKEALLSLVESFNKTQKISINFFSYGLTGKKFKNRLQTTVYRIAQEQLTNIVKHAQATLVDFYIVATSEVISLRIQDNGRGFDALQKIRGTGLKGMANRVLALNGRIDIETAPGEGCMLDLEIPL